MQIQCWYCHKPVSNDLQETIFFRAIAVCPECIKTSPEAENHPLLEATDVATDCDHDWVSADNEVVSGTSICAKCKSIIATAEL